MTEDAEDEDETGQGGKDGERGRASVLATRCKKFSLFTCLVFLLHDNARHRHPL